MYVLYVVIVVNYLIDVLYVIVVLFVIECTVEYTKGGSQEEGSSH